MNAAAEAAATAAAAGRGAPAGSGNVKREHPSCSPSADAYGNAHDRRCPASQECGAFGGRWPYAAEPDVQSSMFMPGWQPRGSIAAGRCGYYGGGGKRVWATGSWAGGGGTAPDGARRDDDGLRNLALLAKAASEGDGENEG